MSISTAIWDLQTLNRKPYVDAQRKLASIGRERAQVKLAHYNEEDRLWQQLYSNECLLKTSIARHSLAQVKSGSVVLPRPWKEPHQAKPIQPSEGECSALYRRNDFVVGWCLYPLFLSTVMAIRFRTLAQNSLFPRNERSRLFLV